MRLLLLLVLLYIFCQPAFGAVDITLKGRDPVRIEDVYQQKGIPFIAVEDALGAVGLSGHWNSVRHTFQIKSRRGWAEISPGSGYMKIGEDFYPLKDKPRFIDGRLRVTDSFIQNQLSMLSGRSIYLRNLDPETDNLPEKKAGGFEQFFAFLLNKKVDRAGPLIRAVAIDPGHGGLDAGVIATSGYKEKQLNLGIAEKLAKKLKMQLGVPIYLSRDGDYELSTEQRLKSASREDVDLWLLLHAQGAFSSEMKGITLFVRPDESERDPTDPAAEASAQSDSRLLARELALSLKESGIEVRGIFPSSRLSLGRGNLPTVQVELGFMTNPEELALLQSDDYQAQVVEALYAGIRRFAKLNKEKINGVN